MIFYSIAIKLNSLRNAIAQALGNSVLSFSLADNYNSILLLNMWIAMIGEN